MELGAVFPTMEIGSDPAVIKDWVQTAEGAGYSYVLTYDHVLGAKHEGRNPPLSGIYTEETAFHEPVALFGFMAAVTTRLTMATGVMVLPQRQTALVAKQMAELELLTGGRVRLGVGTGWNFVEYESLGVPYADRGRMLEEQVQVLRALWTNPVVDYAGQFHRIDRAGICPLPGRPIPIWFGGFGERAYARAARVGDGFSFAHAQRSAREAIGFIKQRSAAEGRDLAAFGFEAQLSYAGADSWIPKLELWASAGGTHACMSPIGLGLTPRQHIEALSQYMESCSSVCG